MIKKIKNIITNRKRQKKIPERSIEIDACKIRRVGNLFPRCDSIQLRWIALRLSELDSDG